MPLIKNKFASRLKNFILQLNKMKQEDAEAAIDKFCKEAEEAIDERLKNMTFTIPPGAIKVTGTAAAQTNPNPIVLNRIVK